MQEVRDLRSWRGDGEIAACVPTTDEAAWREAALCEMVREYPRTARALPGRRGQGRAPPTRSWSLGCRARRGAGESWGYSWGNLGARAQREKALFRDSGRAFFF